MIKVTVYQTTDEQDELRLGAYLARTPWVWIVGVLLAALVGREMVEMGTVWNTSEESSHGFLVLPAFCYLVWRKRQVLAALRVRPVPMAGLLAAGSLVIFLLGKQSGLPTFYRPAVVFLICSYALWLFGTAVWRKLTWSFVLLLFLVPPPRLFLTGVAIPLRTLATEVSCAVAKLFGVALTYYGTTIHLPEGTLEIEAACSGMRGMITLLLFAVFLGELKQAPPKYRVLNMAAALGLALVLNFLRVLLTIVLVTTFGLSAATGTTHEGLGLGIIVIGSVTLAMLPWGTPSNEKTVLEEASA